MAGDERIVVCASGALADGGDGVRFEVRRGGETASAFAVRYEGRVYAYVNRCAHRASSSTGSRGGFSMPMAWFCYARRTVRCTIPRAARASAARAAGAR